MKDVPTLEYFMERCATIEAGGKVFVIEEVDDEYAHNNDIFRWRLLRTFEEAFRGVSYSYQDAEGRSKTVPLTKFWLDHPARKRYHGFGWGMPGGDPLPPDYFVGWRGFAVEPKAGSWEKNKAHIRNVIAGGDEKIFKWIMNWCGCMYQKPGRLAGTAIVMRGDPAAGKGHFAEKMLASLFRPQQFMQVSGGDMLTGEFNGHLSGKAFVFADEALWGGNIQAANRLKAIITEPYIAINRKFMEVTQEPNALHICTATNEAWAAHVDRGERRLCILEVVDAYAGDPKGKQAYFDALHAELDNGGREAMLYEFLHMPVDWDLQRVPPLTHAKIELTHASASAVEHWWDSCLREGTVLDTQDEWPLLIKMRDVHEAYCAFHKTYHGNNRSDKLLTRSALRLFFEHQRNNVDEEVESHAFQEHVKRFPANGGTHRALVLLSLEECRERWLQTRFKGAVDLTWEDYTGLADVEGSADFDPHVYDKTAAEY